MIRTKWRGTWAYDGGVLTKQGQPSRRYAGVVSAMLASGTMPAPSAALAKIETEDTAVATLKFSNGALGIIEATTMPHGRPISKAHSRFWGRRAWSRSRVPP